MLCDGTFKIASQIFEQLLNLNVFVDCKLFPVVYALLKRKNTETYLQVLRAVYAAATSQNICFCLSHFLMILKTEFYKPLMVCFSPVSSMTVYFIIDI